MDVEESIVAIESCSSVDELLICMQKLCECFGFACFNFLDVGNPHLDVPYYMGTTGAAWERDYQNNGFVHVDHCIKAARRSNIPFTWDEIDIASRPHGPKPGAYRLMEAAADYGFQNGLVVPFHYRDALGRYYSSLCVFYWKDSLSRFAFMLRRKKIDLQIIIIYWVQKAVDLVAQSKRERESTHLPQAAFKFAEVSLSDREKDVLAWAARGKTNEETADIMRIGAETVSSHMRNAMRKLDANNKTHAAVRAVYLGLVDLGIAIVVFTGAGVVFTL